MKKAELLETVGKPKPEGQFLLEYQKAVLFALYRDGILDQGQYEACVEKLEHSQFKQQQGK